MTLIELRTAVLKELGVLASGEEPAIGDAEIVDEKYAALYEMLVTEGLVTWTATEDIPEFAEAPITAMVSHLCSKAFGLPQARRLELQAEGALNQSPVSNAERQLRRQLAKGFVYTPMQTDYY